ncbi:GNAT family N-acetyltransferase [Celeribacter neptunius]|uniref:Putative acetyltransferase n=1 Tax=Celeribacter neptunius TaxID=588602 RepID=A0A1I3LXL2_9RHOB|nr:GNAT family N-acetyltransferase [Celeribacter neptunius]SFI89511.1 putative acetyltransferase [Celeribacter neptunius]
MTKINLTLRRYQAEDNAALSRIWRQASERAHPFFTPEQLDEQQRQVADIYLPQAETWVALRGATPLGFIGLLPDEVRERSEGGQGAFIGGLFVAPEAQGQGVGRALIAHARSLKSHLALEVYTANPGARAFYARLGFRETGRREMDDNGLPFPLIRLEL